jgi:hypothetical protein
MVDGGRQMKKISDEKCKKILNNIIAVTISLYPF